MERNLFPVRLVDPASVEEEEQLGSKAKFWFRYEGKRWLFKEPRPGTGEHWAEKIAAEVAALLGLSAARVELAEFSGKQGCAGLSFIQSRQTQVLIHGNELLGGLVTGYRKDQRFRQSEHTLRNIIKAVESVLPSGRMRRLAALHLAGCVVLDALIGNTDRHHENWGCSFTTTSRAKRGLKLPRLSTTPPRLDANCWMRVGTPELRTIG